MKADTILHKPTGVPSWGQGPALFPSPVLTVTGPCIKPYITSGPKVPSSVELGPHRLLKLSDYIDSQNALPWKNFRSSAFFRLTWQLWDSTTPFNGSSSRACTEKRPYSTLMLCLCHCTQLSFPARCNSRSWLVFTTVSVFGSVQFWWELGGVQQVGSTQTMFEVNRSGSISLNEI